MKLVAAFVPGTMADAVAKVNEHNLTFAFAGMQPHTRGARPGESPAPWGIAGYVVFFRLSDLRVAWARDRLELIE